MLTKLLRIGIYAAAAFVVFGGPIMQAAASERPLDGTHSVAAVSPLASVLYVQPSSPAGGLIQSSLRDPDGSDTDQWVWDAFTLTSPADITELRWIGGHDPARLGSGGPVANFTVSIYASIPAGTQPDLAGPPLVRYEVGSNAGETPGPVLAGVQMYHYAFVLPAPFSALGGKKYWVQIEAYQPGPTPDWGLTKGTSGDGLHFRYVAGEGFYQIIAGDTTFSLLGTQVNSTKIYLSYIAR